MVRKAFATHRYPQPHCCSQLHGDLKALQVCSAIYKIGALGGAGARRCSPRAGPVVESDSAHHDNRRRVHFAPDLQERGNGGSKGAVYERRPESFRRASAAAAPVRQSAGKGGARAVEKLRRRFSVAPHTLSFLGLWCSSDSEAEKPGWQGSIANQKVIVNPESFCDRFIIG